MITNNQILARNAAIDAAENRNTYCGSTSRFAPFSLDELHTLNTALGNSTRKLIAMQDELHGSYPSIIEYYTMCISDNEALMGEISDEIHTR